MLKVCLTGATGFIGKNLLTRLENRDDLEVIALSRKVTPLMDGAKKGNITWRRCNGFSLLDVERAIEGADILIYLIHSMLPATALSQGTFSDFDLYLADNFSRAAKKQGIKKIIYLSGFIPKEKKLSHHLLSRLEVEKVLSQNNNDLTVLRSGLIVGLNGSSFRILERLIKRLPILICPSWALSKSQPIDLCDVLKSIEYTIDNSNKLKPVYDIGGPDILTYKEMLQATAKALNKTPPILSIPFVTPALSKIWVSRITSVPNNLISPLIDSLKHQMIVNKEQQLIIENHRYVPFHESLKHGIGSHSGNWVRIIINYNGSLNFRWLENVTSLQRVNVSWNTDAEEMAKKYFDWLPRFLRPFIKVDVQEEEEVKFSFLNKIKLITLKKSIERSSTDRVLYYITGGILARKNTMNGRLEFRWVRSSNCLLIGLLDFRPWLPWFIYKYTQAFAHIFVMNSFRRYLNRHKKSHL